MKPITDFKIGEEQMKGYTEHKNRLEILHKSMWDKIFYGTGELHSCISEAMEEYANLRVKEKLQQIRESLLIKRPLSNGCSLEGVTYGQAWGIDNAIELIDNQINLNKE